MYLINSYKFGGGAPPPIDPDAEAFLTAAAITDPTITSAIDTLVVQLKADGIWTKSKAIYPFVGGTATTHKYNLKDPQDTDAAFRLVFNGGWTHSANGVQGNGVNGYADTFLTPSTALSLNSSHLSYYSRTNVNTAQIEIGVNTSNNYNVLEIRTSGTTYFLINQNGLTTVSDSDSRGFYLGNRQASNDIDGWRQGVKVINGTTVSTILPTHKIFIGAYNNGGAFNLPSTKESAFASIGDGLSDTEAANYYTAVQAFNTSLSRQV